MISLGPLGMNVEGCAITDLLSDRDGLGDGINRG